MNRVEVRALKSGDEVSFEGYQRTVRLVVENDYETPDGQSRDVVVFQPDGALTTWITHDDLGLRPKFECDGEDVEDGEVYVCPCVDGLECVNAQKSWGLAI